MTYRATSYHPTESFIRVATGCPTVCVGDVSANIRHITTLYREAVRQKASLIVFPELSITGYTLGDLLLHTTILKDSVAGLGKLAKVTHGTDTAMIVGFPLVLNDTVYNCAALLSGGRIRGIVPKLNLPNYKEFYEKRWFQAWQGENTTVCIEGEVIPFGANLLFAVGTALVGIEICEDLWVPQPPSGRLALAGATIIANPSASPEQISKSSYRRQLVALQSARLQSVYLYAGCDASESTTDIVMSGHHIIAENGHILAERPPLAAQQRSVFADIDLDHTRSDRRRNAHRSPDQAVIVDCAIIPKQVDIKRPFARLPFVPTGDEAVQVCESILAIQSQALATRLQNSGIKKVVLGVSGGLDSTLALLVAVHAAYRLDASPSRLIHILTMPGEASSTRTQHNAVRLAEALSLSSEVIPINDLCAAQLKKLGHDGSTQDITYENVQARMRTSLLFNRANQLNALVLGTGDLSEIALGWSTFNGDHMSHYNVNASIPKTLVKQLVGHAAMQPMFTKAAAILQSILNTPISPELTKTAQDGISQETEQLVGPYELHDFFLYYFIRWNDRPEKIAYMAKLAFKNSYTSAEITKWLRVFLARFMHNQWKRSVAVDGPKVGSVSLSPRGDWRAPSDMSGSPWISKVQ